MTVKELREAITHWESWGPTWAKSETSVLVAAARAHLECLDSDTLIIRRDDIDYGKASNVLRQYVTTTGNPFWKVAEEVVNDALASSQGVEP